MPWARPPACEGAGSEQLPLTGGSEHLEDTEPISDGGAAGLALPPEMPILIDLHALKDILGPPMYEMEVSASLAMPSLAPSPPLLCSPL